VTTVCDNLAEQISDFFWACAELAEARSHQQEKDTPGNHAAVAEWRATIDLILDMFLESGRNRQ
jgi:hypothetical protein